MATIYYLTFEHTALCLFILFTLSWSCGRPHALIQGRHFSKVVFGLGNKMNRPPCNLSGKRSSLLHVPQAHLKTMINYTGL